ncbi:MAG: glycosyltransferase family 2 protein [Lachnospiraceae bacterium]|nr:glycosyltransferase family 2 protein [Lachnospiraceae bacterium]
MSLVSLIVPSYNEEDNINNTVSELTGVMESTGEDYEIIFVNDGSKDRTYEAIKAASANNRHVKGLSFSRNFGKEAAIFAGLSAASGDACVVLDCDLQHPPKVIPDMLKLWHEGAEAVEGVKHSRGRESLLHKMFAGLFYGIMSKIIKIDMRATSDYKLLDRKVVDALLNLKETNTFFRALSFWVGFKSVKLEYDVEERKYGHSKWSVGSLFKYAINNATSFSTLPLQIVTFLGFFSIIAGGILGIQTLVKYFMGAAAEGFPTVILLELIIGGFIMLSLGIIGHYVGRIYEEVKGRPRYIISEHTDNLQGRF